MSSPFFGVIGHDYARHGLWRALSEDRLHHAILIQGPQGVGKRTLAETLARTLLCEAREMGPCERCAHCRRTGLHQHPDMVIIGRESVLGLDEELTAHGDERVDKKKKESERVGKSIDVGYMRLLGTWLMQRGWEAKRRVAVVVDAERMNVNGASAFLKSLEEPAQGTVVVLTSSSPAFLRPTIRSRCATIRLAGIPQGLIEKRLIESGMSAEAARVRAQTSGGSLSRALQPRASLHELRGQLLQRFGGKKDAEWAAFAASATGASKDNDRDATLHLFATVLRDIAVLQTGGPTDALIHTDAGEELQAAAAGPVDAIALFFKVVEARERLAGQANRVSLWDDLLHDAGSGR